MWKKRHLALLPGRVSRLDPAVPMWEVRRCSCSRVAVPSRDPGTRLQRAAEWRHHSSQSGTPRKGDQPKDWRAPSQETALTTGIPVGHFFNLAGVLKHASLVSYMVSAHVVRWFVVNDGFDESVFEIVVFSRRWPARYCYLSRLSLDSHLSLLRDVRSCAGVVVISWFLVNVVLMN